jgi:hypothetical protein
MKIVLFSLALLGSQPVVLVSDHVPRLDVEATCRASSDEDIAVGLSEPQSMANCMRDETSAQQQLGPLWQTTTPSIRDRCEGEATAGGSQSYVDLLTCIQMTNDANFASSSPPLRGASKNRNKK